MTNKLKSLITLEDQFQLNTTKVKGLENGSHNWLRSLNATNKEIISENDRYNIIIFNAEFNTCHTARKNLQTADLLSLKNADIFYFKKRTHKQYFCYFLIYVFCFVFSYISIM